VRIISWLVILIIVVFGISFATLNSDAVTVNYYFDKSTMPLSVLLVLVFVSGCLIGMIASLGLLIRSKIATYRLNQRLNLAEKEIENLRAIPLQDKV